MNVVAAVAGGLPGARGNSTLHSCTLLRCIALCRCASIRPAVASQLSTHASFVLNNLFPMQDYFRHFSQDDLRALLPLLRDPRDDPAYKVGAALPLCRTA